VAKKHIVRVVLSLEQKEILDNICRKLGQSESETLRISFPRIREEHKPHNGKSALQGRELDGIFMVLSIDLKRGRI